MAGLRSLLYVPGNRQDLLAKIDRFAADAYILDLEDGVPETEKERARELLAREAPKLLASGRTVHARVNPPHTPWHRADVEVALGAGVTYLHIPKVTNAADLAEVDHHAFELVSRWRLERNLEIYPAFETSKAILQAAEICAASPRIAGIVLGADDLTAEWGVPRTAAGAELAWVRQHLIVVAHAFGVAPIDATYPFHQDLTGCEADARVARSLGFHGKQAIHPSQCPIYNQAFTPSPQELERARAIVAAATAASAIGRGTASAAGTQIDAAVLKAARRLLEASRDQPS